jgi:hypothetical protein
MAEFSIIILSIRVFERLTKWRDSHSTVFLSLSFRGDVGALKFGGGTLGGNRDADNFALADWAH